MTTLLDRLTITRNRPAGFDWMRLVLACGIVAYHTVVISYGRDVELAFATAPLWRPLVAALLGMFFVLSGFLVSGSLERCRSMVSFAGLRVMRIFPALVVEVLISAIVVGPLLTHYSLHDYLTDWQFRHYLTNMFGIIHFDLPGVFPNNPMPFVVNQQLWTVPFELECYEVLLVISVLGAYRRKWLLLAALAGVAALLLLRDCSQCVHRGRLQGEDLVFCFLLGVALFRFRDRVIWAGWLGAASAVAAAALFSVPGGDLPALLPMAYLTVYLGLLNPPRVKLLFGGDYSYGLFLYGFPIQQAIASAGPWAQHWYVSLGLGLPLTAVVAVVSWTFVEKPVLSRKAGLIWLEDRFLAALGVGHRRFPQAGRLLARTVAAPGHNGLREPS